jgi:hypothetical protein
MDQLTAAALLTVVIILMIIFGPKKSSGSGGGGVLKAIAMLPTFVWRWLIIPAMIALAVEVVIALRGGDPFSLTEASRIYLFLIGAYAALRLFGKKK